MKLISACRLFVATMLLCSTVMLIGQSDCSTFAYVLGNAGDNARGYSIAADPLNGVIYIAGVKRDSAVIVQMGLNGELHWVRTFDVVPGRADHIVKVFIDSEGMLALAGTTDLHSGGGTVFVFRYDPINDSVLWAREIRSTSTNFCLNMIEMGPGGNYLLSNDPQAPNNAELLALSRANGALLSLRKHYDLGSAESLYYLEYFEGKVYATARFTNGFSVAQMRNALMRIDPQDGSIDWIRLGHININTAARFYGYDLVIHDNQIISVHSGDDDGASINATQFYVQMTTLDGTVGWLKKYNLPGGNDWVDDILRVDNGYVLMARNWVTPTNITLINIDPNGIILWSKQYDLAQSDSSYPLATANSQIVRVHDWLYFTAGYLASMVIVRTDMQGNLDDSCMVVHPVNVTVTDVLNPFYNSVQPAIFNYTPQFINLSVEPRIGHLNVHSICKRDTIATYIQASVCLGQDFEGYISEGEYTDYFISASGCDSIRVLHLEVGSHETYVEMTICSGNSFESYTTSGIYLDTLPGETGACDTLRTLELTVQPPGTVTIDHMMCEGETYMGYASAGTYTDTLTTAMGCDSIRVLHLSVELQELFVLAEICAGESLYGYTNQGIYTDTVPDLQGACDTVRTLHLLVNDAAETFYAVGICEGESVYGHSTQGIHIDTLTAENGCDSIRTLELTVSSATPPVPLDVSVCDNPFGFTQPGEYIDTLIAESGCDSVVVVSVSGAARFIPNIFSPNGDGVNDVFEVLVPSYDVMELEYFAIFDRFGGMVYDTRQWPVRWDGRGVEGQVFNPGVFAWVFIYICNGRRVIESGDVTLVR